MSSQSQNNYSQNNQAPKNATTGKTLIIGAKGKIASLLIPMLNRNDIPSIAMQRQPAETGSNHVVGDLEQDFSHAFNDCDRVVFTAGSGAHTGADKTLLVDLWGAKKAVDYAREHQIKHFVMVSSRGATDPDKGPVSIKPYLIAKYFADEYLKSSGVLYTILRPGRLTDEPGTGLVTTIRPEATDKQFISRRDTASAILTALETPACVNKIYELYYGTTPIAQALI